MDASKEISLKLREIARIRRKIKQNEILAFRLSLQDPQDFDNNPFRDEIRELQLREIHMLQEIQHIKLQCKAQFNSPYFLIKAFEG